MSEEEELELFYITRFHQEGAPKFKDLDESQKKAIKNTFSFAAWQLNQTGEKLVSLFKEHIKKFAEKF